MVDRHGRDVCVAIAKIAYEVSARGVIRLARRIDIRLADVPTAPGPWSSIRLPSDAVEEKPGTDLLLVGTAEPARRATWMDVTLRVAAAHGIIEKTVRVFGPRVFVESIGGAVTPGPAAGVVPTRLAYEHAWGGHDGDGDQLLVDWRNPAGVGVAADRKRLVGRPAPRLEDPAAGASTREPTPAAFAPLRSDWLPRSRFCGTQDEAWRRERAPLRPRDFDPRHNCVAPLDLWSAAPLSGGEPIEVTGVLAEGPWRFQLPRYEPRFRSFVGGTAREHRTHLDTLLLDADERRVELTWRAAVPLPRKQERFERVEVGSDGALEERVVDPPYA
jgi:hypothetical protein